MRRICCPTRQSTIDHPDVGDDALVVIELRVEDQGSKRGIGISRGVRNSLDHGAKDVGHPLPCLGADGEDLGRVDSQAGQDLFLDLLGPRCLHIDLVEHGDNGEIVVHRQVGVGDGLCLHALGRVDQKDRSFAGRQAARDLVVKVDVAGGVDEVQLVGLAVERVIDRDGAGLDGDSALALEIHIVEELLAKFALGDGARLQEKLVGQRALTVIDMGDDREISDELRVDNHRTGALLKAIREAGLRDWCDRAGRPAGRTPR